MAGARPAARPWWRKRARRRTSRPSHRLAPHPRLIAWRGCVAAWLRARAPAPRDWPRLRRQSRWISRSKAVKNGRLRRLRAFAETPYSQSDVNPYPGLERHTRVPARPHETLLTSRTREGRGRASCAHRSCNQNRRPFTVPILLRQVLARHHLTPVSFEVSRSSKLFASLPARARGVTAVSRGGRLRLRC